MKPEFDTIEEAVADLKQGKMIILVDDEDRENEGDLCCAADLTTPEIINFMAKHGRGLICLTLTDEQTKRLKLPLMTSQNYSPFHTNFTASIEAARGVTTGISAADRAHTILTAANPAATPDDIVVPGHIFPLQARPGGVLQRAGQTEGSVDLARLSGLNPAGVICEIMNDDGTMARYPQLREFSRKHDMKLVTIKDLIEYQLTKFSHVECVSSESVETVHGPFQLNIYTNRINDEIYLAYVAGRPEPNVTASVRVHSHVPGADLTRALLGNDYIGKVMQYIQTNQPGVFLYLIKPTLPSAVMDKIKQFLPSGTSKTNHSNEITPKFRDYGFGAQVIRDLGFTKLRLISSSPHSPAGIQAYGFEVTETICLT